MRGVAAWLGGLFGAACLFGGAAFAQDYPALVRGYLDTGMAAHAEHGYHAERGQRDLSASLRLEGAQIWTIDLRGGENYRVYGACDSDCSDVDMELYGPDGALVDRDVGIDDTPYVQVTPQRGGRYYVRMWLASCTAEPCYVGARVVSGGQPAERQEASASGDGGDYTAHVLSLLQQAAAGLANDGYTPIPGAGESEIEALQTSGQGQSVAYQLEAGRAYRFVGACDQDCTDLDIAVTDARGQEVASNYAVDNPTTVDFTPQRAGAYTVRIWLAACGTEPCYSGQRGFARAR